MIESRHYAAWDMTLTGLVRLFDLYESNTELLETLDRALSEVEPGPLFNVINALRQEYAKKIV
jgi:hypothetical protein